MPLKVSDGIGTWIKDFKKSDAPQFKGKNEKERRDMAVAAYLDAKRESVEEKTYLRKDPKLPNLKVSVKGPRKGKILNKKTGKFENVKSADRKPEVYTKPDGKRGVRMVPTDKNITNEDATFKVNIEGLPMVFMTGMGSGDVKAKLRKIVKQPSMIQDVERVTDAEVKKTFRLKAQGREEEETNEEMKYDYGSDESVALMKKLTPGQKNEDSRGADSKGHFRSTKSGAGMTAKGVAAHRRKNPGSKLKTAVTGKVKPGSKDAARRRSFCARMSGMKGPMKDEKGRPTRKAMSLRRWRCR